MKSNIQILRALQHCKFLTGNFLSVKKMDDSVLSTIVVGLKFCGPAAE